MESSTTAAEARRSDVQKKLCVFSAAVWKEYKTRIQHLKATLDDGSPSITRQAGDLAAAGASGNPLKVGFGLLKQSFTAVQKKQTLTRAKRLSALVYQYHDNKESCKDVVVQGCVHIFHRFEMQFVCCYVDEEDNARALAKLGSDVAIKVINYFIIEEEKLITVERIIKAIFASPDSLVTRKQNELLYDLSSTRTVFLPNKQAIQSGKLYHKAGIVDESGYFKTRTSNTAKYGYRRFVKGDPTPSEQDREENQFIDYNYVLEITNINDISKDVLDYIKKNSPDEMESRLRNDSNSILQKLDDIQEMCASQNTKHAEEIKTVRFQMKDAVSNFVGRENKMEEIQESFENSNKIVCITGPPGIGKTETSRKYYQENRNHFKYFMWFNSETDGDLEESIKGAAIDLRIRVDQRHTNSILQDVYDKIKDEKSLLIFDNVISYVAIKDYLPTEIYRANMNIKILITSQNRDWVKLQFEVIALEGLGDDEARELVEITFEQYDVQINKQATLIVFLNNELGNYPLALQQALAYIIEEANKKATDDPITEYIENYRSLLQKTYPILISPTEKIDSPFTDYYTNAYERTVFVTMQMSFNRLEILNNENALKILRFCSFLNSEYIYIHELNRMCQKRIVNDALFSLKKYSLAETDDMCVRIHRLVLEVTRQLSKLKDGGMLAYQEALTFVLDSNWLTKSVCPIDEISSAFILKYSEEYIEPLCLFFQQLTGARKCQLFLLLVYFGCLAAIKAIISSDKTIYLTSYLHQDFKNHPIGLRSKQENNEINEYEYNNRYAGPAYIVAFPNRQYDFYEEVLGFILDNGADINAIYTNMQHTCSMLHSAAFEGRLDIVEFLLAKGANPNIRVINKSRNLRTACECRSIKYVKQLILEKKFILLESKAKEKILFNCLSTAPCRKVENAIDWNKLLKIDIYFIIKIKIVSNMPSSEFPEYNLKKKKFSVWEILIYLIKTGATACALVKFGKILQRIAAGLGKKHSVSIRLLNKYNILTDPFLLEPTWNRREQFAELVLENKSNIIKSSKTGIGDEKSFDILLSNTEYSNNYFNFTPLHLAVAKQQLSVTQFLIDNGADINATTDSGCSILHMAVSKNDDFVIQWLIEKDVRLNDLNSDGYTALHLAVINGCLNIVIQLSQHADIFALTTNKQSVLHLAAANSDTEVVSFMINVINQRRITTEDRDRIKSFVNLKDESGKTALQYAINMQSFDIVKDLIQCGADVNEEDVDGIVLCRLAVAYQTEKFQLCFDKDNINATDIYNRTALMIASANGLSEMVKLLLNVDNVDINARDEDGKTALMFASSNKHIEIINLLLRHNKINVNAKDNYGKTELMYATSNGHSESVIILLTTDKIDINATDKDGKTALMHAASEERIEMVKLLLDADKCDINSVDEDGKTALIIAASKGYIKIVELLVNADKCDISAMDKDGNTALRHAFSSRSNETVKPLLGVEIYDINAVDKDGKTALILAVSEDDIETVILLLNMEKCDTNTVDKNRKTAIMYAALAHDIQMVELNECRQMNVGKCDINAVDKDGKTALIHGCLRDNRGIVHHLLTYDGIDLNAVDIYGRSAMHYSAHNGYRYYFIRDGYLSLVHTLLDKNIQLNVKDKLGLTELHYASFNNNTTILESLLNKQARVNALDNKGKTALRISLNRGHTNNIKLLLSRGADPNIEDINGWSVLQIAVRAGKIKTLKHLLKYQTNVDVTNRKGESLLHIACIFGRLNVVKFLFYKGANINLKTKDNRTALDIAITNKHLKVKDFLLAKELGF